MATPNLKEFAAADSTAIPFHGSASIWRGQRVFGLISDVFEGVADLLAVVIAVLLAYRTYGFLGIGQRLHYGGAVITFAVFGFAVVFVFMLDRAGAYNRGN